MVTHDERLANSCDVKIDLNKSVEIKTNIIEKEVKEEKRPAKKPAAKKPNTNRKPAAPKATEAKPAE
mgnify:CR=1 FL=1